MSAAKRQGTAWETAIVKAATAAGLPARRLAEGGSVDEGDLEVLADRRWVVEAKCRSALSAHSALAAARAKSPENPVALVWKRLVKVDGRQRRQQAGPPVVVVALDDWLSLLAELRAARGGPDLPGQPSAEPTT